MAQRFHTVRYINSLSGQREQVSFFSYGGPTQGAWGMVATDPAIRPAENGQAESLAIADDIAYRLAEAFALVSGGIVAHDEPPVGGTASFGAYRHTLADFA